MKELTINIMPISVLNRYIIPRMLQRGTRSGIINLSSYSKLLRLVESSGYCSTKLFDEFLSKTLAYEYEHKIDILSSTPNLVSTPLTRNAKTLLHINKNQTAKGTLKDLGHVKTTYGHWSHHLQGTVTECVEDTYILQFIINASWDQIKQANLKINSDYSVIK